MKRRSNKRHAFSMSYTLPARVKNFFRSARFIPTFVRRNTRHCLPFFPLASFYALFVRSVRYESDQIVKTSGESGGATSRKFARHINAFGCSKFNSETRYFGPGPVLQFLVSFKLRIALWANSLAVFHKPSSERAKKWYTGCKYFPMKIIPFLCQVQFISATLTLRLL